MIVMELNVMIHTDTVSCRVECEQHSASQLSLVCVCVQFSKKRYSNHVLSVETYSLFITLSQISIYVNVKFVTLSLDKCFPSTVQISWNTSHRRIVTLAFSAPYKCSFLLTYLHLPKAPLLFPCRTGLTKVYEACTMSQANSAFHPFGVDKWVVGCN